MVGRAIGQAQRQASRISPVQEDRGCCVVSAAQQTPQRQTRRDPDSRTTTGPADLHPARLHPARPDDAGGWVGVDRGLSAFVVAATADGAEAARTDDAPKALATAIKQQRRLAKSLSRKTPSCRQCAPPFPAPGIGRAGQDPRPDRHREPQRGWHAGQSPQWPAPSPMPAGRNSPGCCATSRRGATGSSSRPTAGILRPAYAPNAASSTAR